MPRSALLVDADPDNRAILRALLEYEAYRVVECTAAEDALRIARDQLPGVIVTEFMVCAAGRDCCVVEALAHDPRTATIPAIVLTTYQSPEAEQRVHAAGGVYLVKPLHPHETYRMIRDVMTVRSGGWRRPATRHALPYPQRGAGRKEW